jgi:hypothetical protein
MPRELSIAEVSALWKSASPDARLVLAALFSGVTLPELSAMTWGDVDFDSSLVAVGPTRRLQPITLPFADELKAKRGQHTNGDAVAVSISGHHYTVHDLEGLIAAAAHDAALNQSEIVDASAVRQTYINFLVRQGIRLSELESIVGPIAPASFLYYRNLSPAGGVRPFSALDSIFPTFRNT